MFNLYQMPYSDIRKCDCGSKKHPRFSEQQLQPTYKPLLADLLAQTEVYHRQKYPQQTLYYNIETKTTPRTDDLFHPQPAPFVELLMEVITKQQLESRVCIQSFDVRTLQYVHQKYPHITTALLVWKGKNVEKNLKKLGFIPTIYSPHLRLVDAAMIAYLHQKGVKVIPWTVNEVADMERLIALQVDGLISDYPNRYMAWRQEQQPPISIKILSDEKDDNSVTVQSTDTAYRAIFDSQSGYGKATIAALQADKASNVFGV
jgi:glycerophosphoryl diester phosphodiesterase